LEAGLAPDDEEPPTVWVSFDLFGATFDPDAITRDLGIEPTSAHRRGDPIKDGKARWPRDRWRITIGPEQTIEIGRMLDDLLDRLRPAEQRLRVGYEKHGVESMITCTVEPTSRVTPYILFPDYVVKWSAEQGVAISVGVMLWREDDGD
jgi:hypothetical protein